VSETCAQGDRISYEFATGSPAPASRTEKPRQPPSSAVAALHRRGGPAALITAGLWPKPVPVETAVVTSGLLRATVNEEGKTRVKQRYLVSAPLPASSGAFPSNPAAEVRAGKRWSRCSIRSPRFARRPSRASAEARRDTARRISKSRGQSRVSASEWRRYRKLFEDKTVAAQNSRRPNARGVRAQEEASAQSALRQAEAELAAYASRTRRHSLARQTHRSQGPGDGQILRVIEENSRVVSAGTPLMELAIPPKLEW